MCAVTDGKHTQQSLMAVFCCSCDKYWVSLAFYDITRLDFGGGGGGRGVIPPPQQKVSSSTESVCVCVCVGGGGAPAPCVLAEGQTILLSLSSLCGRYTPHSPTFP